MNDVRERTTAEKLRSTAWLLGSLLLSALFLFVVLQSAWHAGISGEKALVAVALLSVELHIFGWGVRRWDITPPSEFRAAAEEGDDA